MGEAASYLEIGRDQEEKLVGLKCRSAVLLGEHSEDYDPRSVPHTIEVTRGKTPVSVAFAPRFLVTSPQNEQVMVF